MRNVLESTLYLFIVLIGAIGCKNRTLIAGGSLEPVVNRGDEVDPRLEVPLLETPETDSEVPTPKKPESNDESQSRSFLTTPTVFPSKVDRIKNYSPNSKFDVSWNWKQGFPNQIKPYHLRFDNPHDDDLFGERIRSSCAAYIDAEEGALIYNRINTKEGRSCPKGRDGMSARQFNGNLATRLPFFTHASGATFKLVLKVFDLRTQVQHGAAVISYIWTHGSIQVSLSPKCVKIGPLRSPSEATRHSCSSTSDTTAAKFDLSDRYHTLWLTVGPGNHYGTLYIDGRRILTGKGASSPFVRKYRPGAKYGVGDGKYEDPFFLTGDNTSNSALEVQQNIDVSAAIAYKSIEIKHGVYAPLSRMMPTARTPPRLPMNVSVPKIDGQSLEFDTRLPDQFPISYYRGDAKETFHIGYENEVGEFVKTDTPPKGKGVLWIRNSKNGSYLFRRQRLKGIYGNGDWAIEVRAKVLPGHTTKATQFNYYSFIGMPAINLSLKSFVATQGGKFFGDSDPVPMEQGKWNVYRMVGQANDRLFSVFLNDIPRPAVDGMPGSAHQDNIGDVAPRLFFGFLYHLIPKKYKASGGYVYPDYSEVNQNVMIDYIRWMGSVPMSDGI